ncbi:hypothetical protein CNMCM5793_006319 [Aspergillus hiratsukae]|uniref:Enoyl reductase (ER) domain-containing protein n=1 Tax=Aspergillus hiratsukae TaxID=1194566 RepID=A0A8H6PGQ3_9EURO|nr:hypothetical protein CNMCM5793_006319 [Aspergillus hiratsukae]
MSSLNRSLWQDQAGVPGVIRESPIPCNIADNEILVKVHAWAMNPADAMVQDVPLPFIKYPLILGEDVAGTVESAGSAAKAKFQPGDRVLGLALAWRAKFPTPCLSLKHLSFPSASRRRAHGLFSKDYLALPFPTTNTPANRTGKSIFIWGGSSGVGSNAIQLSKAAGFEVFTTCSARNFEYVKDLGADHVYDYNDPDVISKVVAELDKGECIGVLQAAGDVSPSCQVAHQSKQNLRVAATNPVSEWVAPDGVDAKMIFASGGGVIYHETTPATFAGYLPDTLAKGVYKVAPPPEVVPTKGLEGIQEALNLLKKGVSAKKLVTLAN